MALLLVFAGIVVAAFWWRRRQQTLNRNERLYLKRRGYAFEDSTPPDRRVAKDTRLLSLLESLTDVSPYARQRAAEELSTLCQAGKRDARMLEPLVNALADHQAAVRNAVTTALKNLRDPRALTALEQRLAIEESIQVSAALKQAIAEFDEPAG